MIWKPVVGYEGLYEVSDEGFVKSLSHYDTRGHLRKAKILADTRDVGHYRVNLTKNGWLRGYSVHVLMLEAFIGPRPVGMNGLHRDDNIDNNSLENLYWGTQSQNLKDAYKNGKRHACFQGNYLSKKTVKNEPNRNTVGEVVHS